MLAYSNTILNNENDEFVPPGGKLVEQKTASDLFCKFTYNRHSSKKAQLE